MKRTVELDASNRIVVFCKLRRAANVIGRVVKRGKLKIWTGAVPAVPIEKAVEQARYHLR